MLHTGPDSGDISPSSKAAVLSVSSLNRLARSLLEGHFPAVRVEGEISNLAQPASGHWYLTLKDAKSQLRCAMFVNRNRQVRFRPANGQQIIVSGRLSIYEGRGDYQLIVDSMEQAGDGALQRAFEELKAKLDKEGLFDVNHKQEVGNHYQHIGLITSASGAAIRDLISVFARRFPAIRLTLFPVAVQGQAAAGEIVAAIELANKLQNSLGLQALIVGRGGGSLEDLQAFNEESVARAIFNSSLPITSAVGHEVDFTIADFVADLRAPTPSAAAELMSPSQDDYAEQFSAWRQVLQQSIRSRLLRHEQQLAALARHLKRPDRRLQDHAQTLDRLEIRLQRAGRQALERRQQALQQLQRSLYSHSPQRALQQSCRDLSRLQHQLGQNVKNHLLNTSSQLAELSRGLNAVSPLNTLARGYSISRDSQGAVIRSSSEVSIGDAINVRLAKGSFDARISSVHNADQDSD